MNLYKKFLSLVPQQKVYYGQIISINFDKLTIEILGGGILTVVSSQYASSFSPNDWIWLTDNGQWQVEPAPQMPSYEILI